MVNRFRGVALALVLLLEVGACKKSEKTEVASGEPAAAPASPSVAAATPPVAAEPAAPAVNDSPWAKPSLTDDKLERYIKSLSEKSPFDEKPSSFEHAKALTPKLEAFAKKYEFASVEEYADVSQRIIVGTLQTGATDGVASIRASLAQVVANTEKQLADPAATPEAKVTLNEMLTSTKAELAQYDAEAKHVDPGAMNAADMALIKKFQSQIAAAEKAKLELK